MDRYSAFKFSKVQAGAKWFGVDIAGLPIMYLPTGEICEPFVRYFTHGWRKRIFKTRGSMNPEKYSLRDWFAHCYFKGVYWLDADDDELSVFRDTFAADVVAKRLSAAQVELKLSHVFKFYRIIPDAMPFHTRGRLMRRFVGNPDQDFTPITSSIVETRKRGPVLVWSRHVSREHSGKKRPTPNSDQVQRILDHLRFKVKEERAKRANGWAAKLRRLEGERNWLIARSEAEAGLRRHETAALNLKDLSQALAEERLLGAIGLRDVDAAVHAVVEAATDSQRRDEIIARIEKYRSRGHETLYVTMQRKRKVAAVQFPLDLIIDILTIGVWKVRHEIALYWQARKANYQPPPEIFLSSRNGLALEDGSVGDIVNDAFKELDIAGSGHRLRAHYLTHMAWLIWNENFALGGYRFDVAVVNMTLDRLTELAGHAEPSILERHYLDMALLRHFSRSNRARMNAMSELMSALIYAGPLLTDSCVQLLESVIFKLSDDSQPHFPHMLKALLEEFPSSNPPPNQRPKLTVVK